MPRELQCVAVCCSVLQRVAACCRVSATRKTMHTDRSIHTRLDTCSMLQCVTVCGCMSQLATVCCGDCVAVRCGVLQCVALCCSVVQCVAARHSAVSLYHPTRRNALQSVYHILSEREMEILRSQPVSWVLHDKVEFSTPKKCNESITFGISLG